MCSCPLVLKGIFLCYNVLILRPSILNFRILREIKRISQFFRQILDYNDRTISSYISYPNTVNTIDLISRSTCWIESAIDTTILYNEQLDDSKYFNVLPGEHYRLLSGICKKENPSIVVEIGTYTGMGTKTIQEACSDLTKIHTFDIIPWTSFDSHLTAESFDNARIKQHLVDLSVPSNFSSYSKLFQEADIIFLDGPKDAKFEFKFLNLLSTIKPNTSNKKRYLIIDDIKFLNMGRCWNMIKSPKIDLTSYGHWTGTGICDITEGLEIFGQFA